MSFSEWEEVKLGDVIEIRKNTFNPQKNNEILRYIGLEHIQQKTLKLNSFGSTEDISSNKYFFSKGEILFGKLRPYFRKVIKARFDGVCSTDIWVLRPENNSILDSTYLFYLMASKEIIDIATKTSTGTRMPRANWDYMSKLSINIPSLSEQKAISKILSTLDDKIELNDQINKKLENMAQAIFKHWFVDFEFPNKNGEPYKSSGGKMIESEMGMIPEGWKVNSLDNIAEFLNGLAMQKYRAKDGEREIPVLKIKELRQGFTDVNSDLCSEKIEDRYIIKDGDIIFSWSGSLLIDIWCGGICGLNQHLFKVTSNNYDKWFYYHWNKYHLKRFISIAESKATTMGHIKRKDLSDSKVLIPTNYVYNKANKVFTSLYNKIIDTKIEIKHLELIRDTLLPKLMSGEIRVPLEKEGGTQ